MLMKILLLLPIYIQGCLTRDNNNLIIHTNNLSDENVRTKV